MSVNNKANLGWHYYRNYFINENGSLLNMTETDLKIERTEKIFKQKNKEITDTTYNITYFSGFQDTFSLVTTYPGLLLGSGYGHEISAKGELKLGFFFDYTTGLPVIPGSSIKGVIRSVFPDIKEVKEPFPYELKSETDKVRVAWLKAQLDNIDDTNFMKVHYNPVDIKTLDKNTIEKYILLTLEIFEGIKVYRQKKSIDKYYSIYERDIFHDAVIKKAGNNNKIVGDDSITPHIKENLSYEQSMLKNPVPIPFLKVLPNVTFAFNFNLNHSITLPVLTIINKTKLFQKILLTIGLGAKTNVGYGQFVPVQEKTKETNDNDHENTELENNLPKKNPNTTPITLNHCIKDKEFYKANSKTEGIITNIANGYYVIAVGEDTLYKSKKAADNKLTKEKEKKEKKGVKIDKTEFIKGEKVIIRVNKDFEEEINFTILPF
jgi:CRISPR-associated protein Cmr6